MEGGNLAESIDNCHCTGKIASTVGPRNCISCLILYDNLKQKKSAVQPRLLSGNIEKSPR